jgi:L-malate glycosyltransferase
MHVLIIPSWYPQYQGDPSGSFFREQAIGLKDYVKQVGVLFNNQRSVKGLFKSGWAPSGIHYFEDYGVDLVIRNGINWSPRFRYGILAQWLFNGMSMMSKYIERYGRPDIIHAHCAINAGILAREIHKKTGIPYVMTEHSTGYFKGEYAASELRWAHKVFESSSANITVSNNLHNFLEKKFGGEDWVTIPNIVSSEFFQTNFVTLNDSKYKFLNVAFLNPIKRQDLLIDAVCHCRNQGYTNIELTIAGDGPERQNLQKRIKHYGLQEQIFLVGSVPRSDVPALMASHDAFVLSSDYETFGVVVGEALASGLPCIVTNCGGPEDIVKVGDGVVVPIGEPKEIALAMLNMASNHREPFGVRQLRRDRCEKRFSKDSVLKSIINVYYDVLA